MSKHLIRPLILALGLAPTGTALAQSGPADAHEAAQIKPSAARDVFDTSELDDSVGACTNLNTFVNAQWIEANPIPEDKIRWGSFDQLADKSRNDQHTILQQAARNAERTDPPTIRGKIGRLFISGMDDKAINKAGHDPIKPRLAQIDAIDDRQQLSQYLINAFAAGQGQVFELAAGPDYKNATQVIAYVYQGGLGLPTPAYYTDDQYADQRAAYVDYMTQSFQLLGESESQARADAQQAMAFETQLAKHSLSRTAMRDPKNQYHFVTLSEAERANPHFDWKAFFAAQNADIKKGFSLSEPGFFKAFDHLLAEAPLARWKAYLRFHTVDDAAPLLSETFRDNHFGFYGTTLNGQPEQKERWKQVLESVNNAMGQALGQLYVQRYFSPEAKARAEKLVGNIHAALKTRLKNADWMSEQTRQKALDKWSKFLPKIGYPDTWRSWDGLKISADDYYGNMQAAAQFNHDYEMAYVGQHRDRKRWSMTPQTVNAYYNPTDNTINFPAAILQPPFFYAHGDDAVNYGGIGAVIGHESSHGYDDQGSQFDGDGNQENWWTQADREAFNARTQKLVEQFNQYTPIADKPELHVKGKLTLGENIADLVGLRLAYDALQTALADNPEEANSRIDGYTQNQRFFMAWARVWRGHIRPKAQKVRLNSDPHAPMQFRAIGAPSNMDAFARAFDCQPGAPMVRPPKKQVVIW